MKSASVIQQHLPVEQFEFVELVKQLESDMSGLFNGHVAGYIDRGRVCFVEEYEPDPDVEQMLDEHQLFLPFTSPDSMGGMVYDDGSPVCFERDLKEEPFEECDCYGYLVSREAGEYFVESGLCTLNTIGSCSRHHFTVARVRPDSEELWGKMETYLNRFIKPGTRGRGSKQSGSV
jgi:hypothetical protein